MNLADVEGKNTGEAALPSATNTRLTGPWLIIARVVWLALVAPSLGLFVISLPVYYQQLQRGCVDYLTCSIAGALPVQVLSRPGFPVSAYVVLLTVFIVLIEAIWCGVGFLLFLRRSDDWLALLAALFLVLFNTGPALPSSALILPYTLESFLGSASIGVFLLLFPQGRLIPRWIGLILLLEIVYQFLDKLPSKEAAFDTNWPEWLYVLANLIIYGAIIYSQIYRYRYVSTHVQRQQTKWVILGVTAAAGFYIGLLVISLLIPSLNNTLFWGEVWSLFFPVATLLIPLSIGFSILRYRLYDIDLLINRTLVYGTLTVILALIYFGSIVGLQALLRGIINANNDVAIVVSTLVIAALFQPLRHRIQAIIDHRFYRRKYDAARTIAAFSAILRNEVDLNQLSEHLVSLVQETMQPTHVSLWVRPPVHNGTQRTPLNATPTASSHAPQSKCAQPESLFPPRS